MKTVFKRLVVAVLTYQAKAVLRKYRPKVVGVTGSVGKTSTKDAVFSVMAPKFHVRKSEKSFNSEIGIPLTVLGLANAWSNPLLWLKNILLGLKLCLFRARYPEWLVLEIGADHPGDIRKVTSWLKPDIAVVTKIPDVPVHVEYFDSPAQVAEEKSYLVRALKREGTLVLNADDANSAPMRDHAPDNAVVTYGFGDADIQAESPAVAYDGEGGKRVPRGTNFIAQGDGKSVPVHIYGSLGRQHVYPALAAIAVGRTLGLGLEEMSESLGRHRGPRGRMRIIAGVKDTTVLDDTYNSSPIALEEALRALKSLDTGGRKIAVLGDMLELGKFAIDEHKKAGELAAKSCDVLVTVGVWARYFAEGALNAGMDEKSVFQFDDSKEAGKQVELMLRAGDTALVKGSQRVRMERAVLEIMAEPLKAEELLVRQDKEWENR